MRRISGIQRGIYQPSISYPTHDRGIVSEGVFSFCDDNDPDTFSATEVDVANIREYITWLRIWEAATKPEVPELIISLEALKRRSGIGMNSIRAVAAGHEPKLDVLAKILKAVDVPPGRGLACISLEGVSQHVAEGENRNVELLPVSDCEGYLPGILGSPQILRDMTMSRIAEVSDRSGRSIRPGFFVLWLPKTNAESA